MIPSIYIRIHPPIKQGKRQSESQLNMKSIILGQSVSREPSKSCCFLYPWQLGDVFTTRVQAQQILFKSPSSSSPKKTDRPTDRLNSSMVCTRKTTFIFPNSTNIKPLLLSKYLYKPFPSLSAST